MTASQSDCIFCKIASGNLGVPFVYESEECVAFNDQAPLADEHILVVPKRHIGSLSGLTRDDDALLGALMATVNAVAEQLGLTDSGFRVVTNIGADAGQTVPHLHFHVLGGEKLGTFGKAKAEETS